MLWDQEDRFANFYQQNENKVLEVTDEKMTRFNITLIEGVKMVDNILRNSVGGEIVVPKIPSFRILDMVKALDSKSKYKVIGIDLRKNS